MDQLLLPMESAYKATGSLTVLRRSLILITNYILFQEPIAARSRILLSLRHQLQRRVQELQKELDARMARGTGGTGLNNDNRTLTRVSSPVYS